MKICIAIFLFVCVVIPIIKYCNKVVKATCKPIMFSYQHVLITGCGTGLGRSIATGVFHRGAVVTMIGKDEQKL